MLKLHICRQLASKTTISHKSMLQIPSLLPPGKRLRQSNQTLEREEDSTDTPSTLTLTNCLIPLLNGSLILMLTSNLKEKLVCLRTSRKLRQILSIIKMVKQELKTGKIASLDLHLDLLTPYPKTWIRSRREELESLSMI